MATAGSAPKQGKDFSMGVESPEPRGFDDAAYEITLTNMTGTQQLGSANIDIPGELTITGEPKIGDTLVPRVGNQLQPRNLALAPDQSVTIRLGLRMPCLGSVGTWIVKAKQSNDFSGTGNDLSPVGPDPVTALTGSCKLHFRAQPASAVETKAITSVAFDEGGAAVSVETLDATGVFTKSFNGSVNVSGAPVGSVPPGSSLGSGTAVDGVAPIRGISIAASGNYNLYARATGITDSDASNAFQVVDVANTCVQGNCKAQVGNAALTGTPSAGSGLALLSLNLGPDPLSSPGCAGYVPPTSDYYEFQLFGVTGAKQVVITNSKAAMKGRGPSSLEVCFAAPQVFKAKDGLDAPAFDYDGPGLGTTGFAALLPDCPVSPAGPCVLDRSPTPGGGATITAIDPRPGDPRMH